MVVDVRHLQAFLAVAEEGSITRAAERLHLTQPAVSRLLSQLEAQLGSRLADRSPHGFALTDAGTRQIPLARAALAAVDAALRPSSSPRTPIRLGYAWAALGADTAQIITAWHADSAHAELILRRVDDRAAGLASGEVDVAIVRDLASTERVHRRSLASEKRVVALPADHPLASQNTVRLRELAKFTVVVNIESGTTSMALWTGGETPNTTIETRSTDDWLLSIAAGRGVGISTTATAETYGTPQVVFRPLIDAPPVRVEVIWPDRPTHPQTTALIAHLRARRPFRRTSE